MNVVVVYPCTTARPQHCCSTCGWSIVSRYPGGLDVVAERFLAETHTPIEQMGDGAVKGENPSISVALRCLWKPNWSPSRIRTSS